MLPGQSRPTPIRLLVALGVLLSLALAGGVLPANATSGENGRGAKARLSISAPGVVGQGQTVVISGTSTPAKAGRVKLQIRYRRSAPWVTMKGQRVRAGTFSFADKVATTRTRWYRFQATRKGKTSTSRAVKVKVGKTATPVPVPFKWYDLHDMPYAATNGVDRESSLRINGVYYTKSLHGYTSSYREYNLSRLCTQLTAVAGLSDDSQTSSQGQVRILGDSVELYKKQFGLGTAEQVNLNVGNVLRIRFEFNGLTNSNGPDAYAALGSPRVYCNTSIEQGMD